jgi:hypothetical protein
MHEEFVSKSWRSYVSFLLLSLDFFWKSSQEYLGKQLDEEESVFCSNRHDFQKAFRNLIGDSDIRSVQHRTGSMPNNDLVEMR